MLRQIVSIGLKKEIFLEEYLGVIFCGLYFLKRIDWFKVVNCD